MILECDHCGELVNISDSANEELLGPPSNHHSSMFSIRCPNEQCRIREDFIVWKPRTDLKPEDLKAKASASPE